jgi:prepilin-type N-terminal cleavage/methylation domain-containing protein
MKRRGMSLVEVLVALVVIVIAVTILGCDHGEASP